MTEDSGVEAVCFVFVVASALGVLWLLVRFVKFAWGG
jgi:hypothetical protein